MHVDLCIWITRKVPYKESRRRRSIPSYVHSTSWYLLFSYERHVNSKQTGHRVEKIRGWKGIEDDNDVSHRIARTTLTSLGNREIEAKQVALSRGGAIQLRVSHEPNVWRSIRFKGRRGNVSWSCGNHDHPFHAEFSRVLYSLPNFRLRV